MIHALLQLRHPRINKERKEFAMMTFLSQLHFTLHNSLQAEIVFLKHLFFSWFATAVTTNRILVFSSSFPLKGRKYYLRSGETVYTKDTRMAKHKLYFNKKIREISKCFFLSSCCLYHSLKRGFIKSKTKINPPAPP